MPLNYLIPKDSIIECQILKKRYAQGEISKDEFDRMRKNLVS
jgi:uncharacterized membrane protein